MGIWDELKLSDLHKIMPDVFGRDRRTLSFLYLRLIFNNVTNNIDLM